MKYFSRSISTCKYLEREHMAHRTWADAVSSNNKHPSPGTIRESGHEKNHPDPSSKAQDYAPQERQETCKMSSDDRNTLVKASTAVEEKKRFAAAHMTNRGRDHHSPLIVSLCLSNEAAEALTSIRKANFPASQNNLDAHLTLLHALPASVQSEMQAHLSEVSTTQAIFNLSLGKLQVRPRIIMLPARSRFLDNLVFDMQDKFWSMLSDQDRQTFRGGHITLCNKQTEDEISKRRGAIDEAVQSRANWHCQAIGLDLWIYRGNRPWEHVRHYSFHKP